MKKIYLVIAVALMLTANFGFAASDEIRRDNRVSLTGTILANASATQTETLTLVRKTGYTGFFSIQPIFTGTGVLGISYQVSNDGKTWSPAVSVVAGAVTGTVYPYPAAGVNIFAGYQRLIFTETGAANPLTVTGAWQCSQ